MEKPVEQNLNACTVFRQGKMRQLVLSLFLVLNFKKDSFIHNTSRYSTGEFAELTRNLELEHTITSLLHLFLIPETQFSRNKAILSKLVHFRVAEP